MYKLLLGTLVLLITTSLFAQQSDQYNGFVLRNYTAVHGLPQSQVNSIIEDENGYLWMGTYGGGLARFDGQDFKVYTTLDGLLSNIISHITIDKEKNLWIVHPRGITRYDGVTFKRFPASDELSKSKMVRRAHIFHDTVFITSAPGVLGKIYKDSVYYWSREYEKGRYIMRIHQLKNGDLCYFLNDGRIILKTLQGHKQIGTLLRDSYIASLYNHGGDMYLKLFMPATMSVVSYVLKSNSQELVEFQDGITKQVMCIDQSTYWLRDYTNLLTLKQGSTVPDTILKDREVNQVYPDSEGNIWIATNGSGLYKYSHQDFSKCSSEQMHGVMSILKDREQAAWIGTMSNGLWRIKNGKIDSYGGRQEILCVAEAPDGTIWVGAREGLGKYNREKNAFEWISSQDKRSLIYSVLNISFDEKGNVWIGTGNGLFFYDHQKFTRYSIEDGLNTNVINSAHYSKKLQTLFVGNEFGVNSVSKGKVNHVAIKGFENTSILSINPYRDSLLLLGSGGAGFAVFNPKTGNSSFINTHEGLVSDFIYFIAADEKQTIWVGTEKGISKVILNNKLKMEKNLHFNHDNGLTGVETNQNAFYLSPKQKFFGLIDGLYEFNSFERKEYNPFKLHLTNVDIFYGEESVRNYADSLIGFFKLPYKPVFPSDKNHITFSFNRVDKRYPNSVQFKYMLKNYDKSWSKASVNKQVTYGNLPPGNYEFQAIATDNQGSWSEVMLRYPFVVKAPFYQTATFGIISFLLLLGIVIFVAYLRVRQRVEKAMTLERIRVREQDSLRKEIARDFHDEMGNQLTRIINYVSLLKLNGNAHVNGNGSNGASSHIDLYTKVENSAKYLYTGTRDFIWSIDPVNDELSKLFIHIRDFGENLFEEKGIQFRANNGVKEKIRLPYGFSREVNLIFKEAMTNTFKYAQCQNATLSLVRNGLGFELSFEDDGIGFNATDLDKLNGLKNIRERADKVQAVLRISSKEGSGTKISLGFQFTKTQQYGATV